MEHLKLSLQLIILKINLKLKSNSYQRGVEKKNKSYLISRGQISRKMHYVIF